MQIYLIIQVYSLKAITTHTAAILNVNTVTSLYRSHKAIKYVLDSIRNLICNPQPHFIITLQLISVKVLYDTLIHTPTSFFTLTCPRLETSPDPEFQLLLFYLGSLLLWLKPGQKQSWASELHLGSVPQTRAICYQLTHLQTSLITSRATVWLEGAEQGTNSCLTAQQKSLPKSILTNKFLSIHKPNTSLASITILVKIKGGIS